jgi:hypothetical protein
MFSNLTVSIITQIKVPFKTDSLPCGIEIASSMKNEFSCWQQALVPWFSRMR